VEEEAVARPAVATAARVASAREETEVALAQEASSAALAAAEAASAAQAAAAWATALLAVEPWAAWAVRAGGSSM
jgi:hypothetical protein